MISAISTAQLTSLGLATTSAIAAIPAVNLPKAFVFIIIIIIIEIKYKLFYLIS